MNKFDTRSMKFLGILIAICVVFLIVIGNAFRYLPDYASDAPKNLQDIEKNTSVQKDDSVDSSIDEEQEEIDEDDIDEPVIVSKETTKAEPLEVIPDEELIEGKDSVAKTTEVTSSEFDNKLNKANDYKTNKQYALAITEYQKAIEITNDAKLKAVCYEEISLIHAAQKHYGSAISAAQRAYNLAPSTEREVVLARLHYKTGDVNKATERINNVLKRDFELND